MNKVLTITLNPSVDIGTEADQVITDQKTRCSAPVYDPGGGGINVSRVLNRLGVHSDALFVAGGYTGNLLKQMMEEESIPTIPIESTDKTRQNISIIDNSIGKQYRFVLPGLISNIDTWHTVLTEIDRLAPMHSYIVASGSLPAGIPQQAYSEIASIAHSHGASFILDTSGTSLIHGLEHGAEFIKPNQEEFRELRTTFSARNDEELCDILFRKGVKNIVHTLGKEKTLLITPEGTTEFKPPTIKLRSTIGAGDSFVGGLVAGLLKGFSKTKSVGYGISAAASTLQSEGTDLCDPQEVEQIFAEHFDG